MQALRFIALLTAICFNYIAVSAQVPSFTMPDTVCVGSKVKITNTSAGGTSYYWNFCVGGIDRTPQAVNLGNPGGALAFPVFMDLVSENGNYYGFLINDNPSGLVRLDFGNSMLNTPVVTDMGTIGGVMPLTGGAEGIQVMKNNGKWYAIIVGWSLPGTGIESRILQVDFGASLANNSPVATDWGNLGALQFPTDLYIFSEGAHWYGFTVNAVGNSITRFDFGNSFETPPVATNIGNVSGLLNYPTGICAIKDGTDWHVFIANEFAPLVRLDFGSSLLNVPTGVSLNTGNELHQPRDLTILRFCDETIGFYVDAEDGFNDIVRLDFHNDLLSVPSAISLGNIGDFNFPHSLTKIFREGADLYCFIPSVRNNTLTRLKFPGCTNSSIPNSALRDPPVISYAIPGTYNVNMMMDEGLESESSFCKSIVVTGPPVFSLGNDSSICQGDSLVLNNNGIGAVTYAWQDGSGADTLTVRSTGHYILAVTDRYGCAASDSTDITVIPLPVLQTRSDTAICRGNSLLLSTTIQLADSVRWLPAPGLPDTKTLSPVVIPVTDTRYIVTAFSRQCSIRDSVSVSLLDTPQILAGKDTLICTGGVAQLRVTGSASYQYQWSPAKGLSDPAIADPVAAPDTTVRYRVTATASNTCRSIDSILVTMKGPDRYVLAPSPANLCKGDTILLTVRADKGAVSDTYTWLSDIGTQDPHLPELTVSPLASGLYQIKAVDNICNTQSVLTVNVNVMERPSVSLTKSNDIDCIYGQAQLTASGDGLHYTWTPAETLSNPYVANPIARTDTNTLYQVLVTGENGCTTLDSIRVLAGKEGGTIGFPVANAFTPNGDGNNDCFGIKFWGYIGDFEMSVFDRWGLRVYYSKDPYQCWDGRFRGQSQPAGTYVYTIRAIAICGTAIRKGTVTLIR